MNAKLKPKLKQMTVTSHHNPIVLNQALSHSSNKCSSYSQQVYSLGNDRNLFGILSPQSTKLLSPVVDTQTNNQLLAQNKSQKPHQSSIILRQKLLHRNRNNSPTVSTNSTKSHRKGYNRSQNNGFKFHNFIVNEDKRACLEEQHGTKKITVSHWKRPVVSATTDITDEAITVEEKCDPICSSTQQQSILEALLAPNSIKIDQIDSLCPPRLNKRKPLHVRRVLRHEQQTSSSANTATTYENMDEDQPLDLSCKRVIMSNVDKIPNCYYYENYETDDTHHNYVDNTQYSMSDTPNESVQHLIKSVNQSAAEANAIIASIKCSKSANNASISDQLSLSPEVQQSSSIAPPQQQFKVNSYVPSKQQKYRQTQRSLIKKQLEETFKQNGFLVKTKQVSDANNSAMFCKFRQLRKYTRYYLKSWHHHLPDEVNKLWKGFLPPKTEKPSSSHT